ncbi:MULTISPECIES: transposase [unclassified Microcoleus]
MSHCCRAKKQTRPLVWTKRQILDEIFYQLKNGCNCCDLPSYLPPYSTVFWHYKQWRAEGVERADYGYLAF